MGRKYGKKKSKFKLAFVNYFPTDNFAIFEFLAQSINNSKLLKIRQSTFLLILACTMFSREMPKIMLTFETCHRIFRSKYYRSGFFQFFGAPLKCCKTSRKKEYSSAPFFLKFTENYQCKIFRHFFPSSWDYYSYTASWAFDILTSNIWVERYIFQENVCKPYSWPNLMFFLSYSQFFEFFWNTVQTLPEL